MVKLCLFYNASNQSLYFACGAENESGFLYVVWLIIQGINMGRPPWAGLNQFSILLCVISSL